jgi:hypothetical protein
MGPNPQEIRQKSSNQCFSINDSTRIAISIPITMKDGSASAHLVHAVMSLASIELKTSQAVNITEVIKLSSSLGRTILERQNGYTKECYADRNIPFSLMRCNEDYAFN